MMSQILPKSQKLYDLTINWQTENTNQLLSQSTNFLVHYGFTHSPFGKALVMGTKQGICGIAFADQLGDEDTLLDMMQRWPRTTFLAKHIYKLLVHHFRLRFGRLYFKYKPARL